MSASSTQTFQVYSASAGAGKTFNLVKSYLILCLRTEDPSVFTRILAITFTVKAAGEMKQRVLAALDAFQQKEVPSSHEGMFQAVCRDLQLDEASLRMRASKVLKKMLHDYTGLSISTIDKFTYRIVRTFSHDLGLSSHFDVELDEDELYRQSVELLLDEAGNHPELTGLLQRYIEDNMEEGRSWKPERAIAEMAQHLGKEGSYKQIQRLKDMSLAEFKEIRNSLYARKNSALNGKDELVKEGQRLFGSIPSEYFNRGYARTYLDNLAGDDESKYLPNNSLKGQVESSNFLKKSASAEAISAVEPITPQLVDWFNRCWDWVYSEVAEYKMISEVLKNFDATAVIREVGEKLKEYKEANNVETLKTFNQLIHEALIALPVPYIYERIGEKYKHYFIDEFQDTSVLQWSNLTPLVHNAIASGGTTMIVGDAKQSIYRWRGGEADQFIDLVDYAQNAAERGGDVAYALHHISLNDNWRSGSEIVNFNNRFFESYARVFEEPLYQKLYSESGQSVKGFEGGYVSLEFLEYPYQKKEIFNEAQISRILEIVKENLTEGYRPGDIAILVRSKAVGELIATALSGEGIEVVSSDSLKLGNSSAARLLVAFLRHLHYPEESEPRLDIVENLVQCGLYEVKPNEFHRALTIAAGEDKDDWRTWLQEREIDIDQLTEQSSGLYELGESTARVLGLYGKRRSDPFLQFFLDELYEFASSKGQNIHDFLGWWDESGHKRSITAPESKDAVQIMTIHKAKGLEFPVCIVPFVDMSANSERKGKRWISFEDDRMHGLPVVELSMKESLNDVVSERYPEYAAAFNRYQLEARFDNLNLLYVALTRPEERLYILSQDEKAEKLHEHKRVSQYLGEFATEHGGSCEAGSRVVFGEKSKPRHLLEESKEEEAITIRFETFDSAKWRDRVRLSRDTDGITDQLTDQPRRWGNAVHSLLSDIRTAADVSLALERSIARGQIPPDQRESMAAMLREVVEHPELKDAFDADEVLSERDWLGNGEIHRPDRVARKGDTWFVIDYKTGENRKRYERQVIEYAQLLGVPMAQIKMYLVFINERTEVLPVIENTSVDEQLSMF